MRPTRPLTPLLSRIYAAEPDPAVWLEAVRVATAEAFEGHAGVTATLARVTPEEILLDVVVTDAVYAAGLRETTQRADASIIQRLRSGVWQLSRSVPPGHPSRTAAAHAGVGDIVSAVGMADAGHACFLSLVTRDPLPRVRRGTRTALGRIAAHLAAAHRMRIAPSPDAAVLSPAGSVLHAVGEAKERAARDRLRAAALGMVRSAREKTADPAAGLAFWRAMADGRWSLVERIESDGKRLLVAKRNETRGVAHGALSPKERAVLERAALGGSVRHVAYELGLPESTVSEALARAMKKLGIRSRAELVELHAALVRDAEISSSPR